MGRLRRAMPMQVYIYICWQLELSGNANLHLYQCWFAFTHRSPIKNFASLRLRKNMVELRARLSLLVDKTAFQYSALTIHYTTIGGRVPCLPVPSVCSRGGRDALDVPGSPPPAPHDAGEWDALNVPGSAPHARHVRKKGGHHGRAGITTRGRSHGRMGRARISTPPPPPWRKGKGWRCAGSSPAPARRGGRDATDAPDHHPSASTPRWKGRPGRAGITTRARSRGGRDALDMLTPSASTARGRPGRHRVPFFRSFASMIYISLRVTCTSFRV